MRPMMHYEDYDEFADEYCKEIIERIKHLMNERDISQGVLAAKSGLGQSTVSKFLAGDTRVSLIHVAKICRALEIDPGEILSLSSETRRVADDGSMLEIREDDMLIDNPTHPAFKGYLRSFKVYFNSTISSENKILQGDLKFQPSENRRYCAAELILDTGKKKTDGEVVQKHYKGKMLISLSMSACYCILTEVDIGEICFMVFNHMFLFHEELVCRLACVTTVSSGGNKRPTMHRLLISRIEFDVDNPKTEDFKFLRGQLMLNTSDIVIEKKVYDRMKETEKDILDQNEIRELLDEFENGCERLEVYRIDESKLRNMSCATGSKVKLISLLREYSMSSKYNKISTKSDEHVYNYLEGKTTKEADANKIK